MELIPEQRRIHAINRVSELKQLSDLGRIASDPYADTSFNRSLYEMRRRQFELGQIADERFLIQVRNGDKWMKGALLDIDIWDSANNCVRDGSVLLDLTDKERETFMAAQLLECQNTHQLYFVDESGERCVKYDPSYYVGLWSRTWDSQEPLVEQQ